MSADLEAALRAEVWPPHRGIISSVLSPPAGRSGSVLSPPAGVSRRLALLAYGHGESTHQEVAWPPAKGEALQLSASRAFSNESPAFRAEAPNDGAAAPRPRAAQHDALQGPGGAEADWRQKWQLLPPPASRGRRASSSCCARAPAGEAASARGPRGHHDQNAHFRMPEAWRKLDLPPPGRPEAQERAAAEQQHAAQLKSLLLGTPAAPRTPRLPARPFVARPHAKRCAGRPGLQVSVQRPPLLSKPPSASHADARDACSRSLSSREQRATEQPASPQAEVLPMARSPRKVRTSSTGDSIGHRGNQVSEHADAPSPAATPSQEAPALAVPASSTVPSDAGLWATSAHMPEAAACQIVLLRSVFEGRPPVLLFRCCLPDGSLAGVSERKRDRILISADGGDADAGAPPKMFYCHTKDTHEYNAVLNTLKANGLHRTGVRSGKWCLCWSSCPKPEALRHFHPFQLVNHFPGSLHIGRKDLMWRNIRQMQRRASQPVEVTPQSFVLPEDMRFWDTAREQNPAALWIWKPVNSSCGRGIKVIRSVLDAATERAISQRKGVVQRYIHQPLLLDGYKFDLRLYVVVTSYDPLRVYLGSEGLVRLATEKYSPSPHFLDHRTMHLTNYAVNKHATSYVQNLDEKVGRTVPLSARETRMFDGSGAAPADSAISPEMADALSPELAEDAEDGGADLSDGDSDGTGAESYSEEPQEEEVRGGHPLSSKWSLQQLREHFASRGLDYDLMMERIKDLVVKSFIAVEPTIVSRCHQSASFQGGSFAQAPRGLGPHRACFEIYGFDVLVDERLTPWLLEVNILPSLSSSSPLDKRIKTQLIAETLTLVGIRPFDYRLVSQARGPQPKLQSPPKSHTVQSVGACSLRDLGHAEWMTILDAHDEFMRRGSLERIFPTHDAEERYSGLFESARYANLVLAKWLKEGGEKCFHPKFAHLLPPWVPRVLSWEPC